jgi:uncharacterized membrane protein YesL
MGAKFCRNNLVFLIFVMCILILSPTNAVMNDLKNSIKIYIKIAPTCFSAVTPSSSSLSVAAEFKLC